MIRVTNILLGVLNFLTLAIALVLAGGSLYLRLEATSECEKFLQLPVLVLAASLFVVSLLGIAGSCCRVTFLSVLYQILLIILFLGLLAFTIFAFVVTNKGAGNVLSGQGIQDYRLGDYSHWLQKRVSNAGNWNKIKSCLLDSEVCRSLGDDMIDEASKFYEFNFSPIQSGCCKPPTYCGFTSKNATFWTAPKSGPAVPDSDCKTWSNNQKELCFDCKTCKASVLANLKNEWKKIAIANIATLLLLLIIYSLGCCVYRNNKNDSRYMRYKGNYPYHT